jgi:hypothetical protein
VSRRRQGEEGARRVYTHQPYGDTREDAHGAVRGVEACKQVRLVRAGDALPEGAIARDDVHFLYSVVEGPMGMGGGLYAAAADGTADGDARELEHELWHVAVRERHARELVHGHSWLDDHEGRAAAGRLHDAHDAVQLGDVHLQRELLVYGVDGAVGVRVPAAGALDGHRLPRLPVREEGAHLRAHGRGVLRVLRDRLAHGRRHHLAQLHDAHRPHEDDVD